VQVNNLRKNSVIIFLVITLFFSYDNNKKKTAKVLLNYVTYLEVDYKLLFEHKYLDI